jgi:hypothetical protein
VLIFIAVPEGSNAMDVDPSSSLELFPKGATFPSTKEITLKKHGAFVRNATRNTAQTQ